MSKAERITIIGGGLAGCEAANQLLRAGFGVRLFEQRPGAMTPAHTGGNLAELVCSNSLRSNNPLSAPGLLKAEMRLLGSLIIEAADNNSLPAGQALAVDRSGFSAHIEQRLCSHADFELIREQVGKIPGEGPVVLATGPLTSEGLAVDLAELIGVRYLHFYDAIAPIITADSIDMNCAFRASRYGKGQADYINCPMNQAEYLSFLAALRGADLYPAHSFEDEKFFEGCLPIEEMARRGEDVLRFGPLKPVGLSDPLTGRQPYAVVQLRQDDLAAELYNIVGFQTRMRKAEQKRVIRMIPALKEATIARWGQMHRNTFINAPEILEATYQVRGRPLLFIAGQLSGVEGYIESAAGGLTAGIYLVQALTRGSIDPLPPTTATGALARYVANANPEHFQPMNINFGLLDSDGLPARPRKRRLEARVKRALLHVQDWAKRQGFDTIDAVKADFLNQP